MNDSRLRDGLLGMSEAIRPRAAATELLHRQTQLRVDRDRRRVKMAVATTCAASVLGVASFAALSTNSDSNRVVATSGSPDLTADSPTAAPTREPSTEPVQHAHGLERFHTSTAADWVTVADHVIVGSVTDDREKAPKQKEVERGEGLLGRLVTVAVDDVVWSRQDAAPAPTEFTLSVSGTIFNGGVGQNRRRVVVHGHSRIEGGHRYVLAIYKATDCKGTAVRWDAMGGGAVIPFDTSTLGAGEIEGRTGVVPDAENGKGQLRAQLRGASLAELRAALTTAKPGPRPPLGPRC